MSREIKFRALLDDWEWYYFDVLSNVGDIIKIGMLPETIGQYTGLKDKNGKEIYEGDIVEMAPKHRAQVVYSEKYGAFQIKWKTNNGAVSNYSDHLYGAEQCEVIGNIYQNPELLKIVNDDSSN